MSSTENQEIVAVHLNQQAEIYLSQGKLDAAHAACLKALSIKPELALACKTLGNILQAKGEIEAAKNCYIQTIKIAPDWAEVHANLGSMYARQQQWEQAIKCYQKAISIKPNIAGFYRNLAKIWLGLGKEQLATECSYQALILEPASAPAKEYLSLGDKLLELGQQEAAITVLNQGIKLNPNFALFYYNLGEVLTKKQQLEQAALAYRRAVELKPEYHLFHRKLEMALKQQYKLKETRETKFNQGDKIIYFTILPTGAGFTDQLLQFMMFYKLGLSLGYKYIHTNFSSSRSSPNIYDFLGFNQYWSVNIKNIDLSNYGFIYLQFDDDNWADLQSLKSLKELQQYCDNYLVNYNYTQSNIIVIFGIKRVSTARAKLLSLINWEISNYQDNLSLRKIYFEYTQNQVLQNIDFEPHKLRLLIHIRAGDVAHIKTPWGPFIKSIKRLEDEGRKFDKKLNLLNCFVNHVNSLDVDDYYRFAKDFICCLGKQNVSTCVFSDGYQRAFDFIKKNHKQMKFTSEQTQEIFKLSDSYESEQFSIFNNLENCTCIIGESDQKLFDLIHSSMMADIFIIGSQQRMIPKFIANYYDLEHPPVIFILYKNRDLSSIMKIYFRDLSLDSLKATLVPVNLDNYQINELVAIAKSKIQHI